jgi:hypothetical protein
MYITRLASNKIHREVGRAKDLSGPRYNINRFYFVTVPQFYAISVNAVSDNEICMV